MFEKEAEEYIMREDVSTENDRVPFDNGYGFQTVSFEDEVKKAFKDGAEFGYNKANEWHFVKEGDIPDNLRYVWTNVGAGYHDNDGWWDDFGRLQGVIAWCEPKFEEVKENEN